MELTPKQKSFLRSRAHDLNPVVMTGSNGLTEAVLKEIEQAIAHHELIKIKLGGVDKETRKTMTQTICEKLGATAIQNIGQMAVIYRPAKNLRSHCPKP